MDGCYLSLELEDPNSIEIFEHLLLESKCLSVLHDCGFCPDFVRVDSFDGDLREGELGWIGDRQQMDALCKVVAHDLSSNNPNRRSANKLISSINKHRKENNLRMLDESTDATRKAIERIAIRKIPGNGFILDALWDYYVYEKRIVDSEAGDKLSQLAHRLHDFFLDAGREIPGLDGLVGWYYGYKPAVRDPNQVVLKYLVHISRLNLFGNMFVFKEFHFNRSFKSPLTEVITEQWDGILIARSSNSMFGIIREIINGTPKNVTLHSPQIYRDGKISQLLGDSIEIVERWGHQTTQSSRIMLESIKGSDPNNDLEVNSVNLYGQECDLYNWRSLQDRQDILSYILPNIDTHSIKKNNGSAQ